jgi:hypothetical protein
LKEVTIEELKDRFIVRDVPPYGFVVMIPGSDFDPDWEALLEDLGFGCVFAEINNEKFTLVKLEKEEGEEERVTRRAGAQPGQKMIHWSDADEERLLKRVEELPGFIEKKVVLLMQEFPGRSAMALQKKYEKLKHGKKKKAKAAKGKCLKCGLAVDLCTCVEVNREKERQDEKRLQDANKEQVRKLVESEEPIRSPILTLADPVAQSFVVRKLIKIEDNVEALLEFTKLHAVYIAKIHCMAVMQALEAQEHKGILLISPKLREHYVEALGSTDGKASTVFLEKAGLLVEASS